MVVSRFDGGKVASLAREFSRLLVKSLGRETVKKIGRMDRAEEDPNVCHSHDFCDANMVMHEAQENLKLNLDLDNQRDVKVWGDAWNFAVKNGFFLK